MNMNKNLSEISFIVHQTGLFLSPAHLLCAISGGQDSIVVLLLLVHLKTRSQLEISLVYCNHFWQKDNFYTLHNLCKLAYLFGFPINFVVPKNTLNSEADGHLWRHTNFSYVAECLNTDFLLTGHTGNDQIETAVWHFLRGTGPKGLVSLEPTSYLKTTAISNSFLPQIFYKKKSKKKLFRYSKINVLNVSWKRPINQVQMHALHDWRHSRPMTVFWTTLKISYSIALRSNTTNLSSNFLSSIPKELVCERKQDFFSKYDCYYYFGEQSKKKGCKIQRPLLNISRSTIKNLIIKNHFPVVQDGTNQNLRFLRNKIRLILMPLFRYYIQNRCDSNINNFLTILEKEQLYLETVVQNLIHLYSTQSEALNSISYLPQSVQLLILKKLLQSYGVNSPKKIHIETFSNTSHFL